MPRTETADPHVDVDPAIQYFGTPVALLSTVDLTGRPNLAPMSSVFWLGRTAVLGLGLRSQTARNPLDTGEVVINECPVALEGTVRSVRGLDGASVSGDGGAATFEVGIEHVHVHPAAPLPSRHDRRGVVPVTGAPRPLSEGRPTVAAWRTWWRCARA